LHRAYSRKHVPSTAYDKSTTQYDYIIIGSGIGGLWLAACLAKFNQTSLVLEQHYTAGGLQHEFTVKGYEFVPGLDYIANLPLVGPMYDMVACSFTDNDLPPLRFTRAGNCTAADQGQCCSHDLAVGDLPVLDVREGLERNRLELLSVYIRTASRSTEEILQPLTDDGRLHLSLFAGDLGESLGDGSFAMQAAVMGHVIEGCYYPESGPAHQVRGMVPTIRSAGGDVLVRAPVREIVLDQEDARAVGVQLAEDSGDCIYAEPGIVSDADLDNTLERLLPRDMVKGRKAPLCNLYDEVKAAGKKGAISHCFGFLGLDTRLLSRYTSGSQRLGCVFWVGLCFS